MIKKSVDSMKKDFYVWIMIALIITVAATVLVGVFIYSENTRYYIQTASLGEGVIAAYKIDRKTGQTWQIIDGKEKIIKNLSNPKSQQNIFETQNLQQKTIEMAKNYSDGTGTMDSHIRKVMEKIKGNLKIFGWKSHKIDDQTYLVSYTFEEESSGEVGYFFEINLVGEVVRNINKDDILSEKYKLKTLTK